jgi:hypothetical protein
MLETDFKKHIAEIKEPKKNSMNKILLIIIILLTTIATYFFVVKMTRNNDVEINRLKQANKELLQENYHLDSLNATYLEEIVRKSNIIQNIGYRDSLLKDQVTNVENKIKKINYEKVNSYSNNFNSKQISSYFADSLR